MHETSNTIVSLLSVVGIIATGVFFLLYSNKYKTCDLSLEQYLMADRNISKKDFGGSFVASGISLGGWIVYFITCHQAYGWLMLIGAIFNVITHLIFILTLKKINPGLIKYKTIAELWFAVFPCKIMAQCFSIGSAIACLVLFFVEVHVGSAILYILFPRYPLFKHLSFFFIGLTVLAYAYRGGYLAVVKTDTLQLLLICSASVAVAILAICVPTSDGYQHAMLYRLFSYEQTNNLVGIFVAWVIANNISGCLAEPTALQRINSIKNIKEAFLGVRNSVWHLVLILCVLLFGFMLLHVKGYHYNNLEDFLTIVEHQTGVFKFIIYPLIVVGFSAALFSTADTNAIAVIYNVCDNHTFASMHQGKPSKQQYFFKKLLFCGFGLIILLMSILHYLMDTKIGEMIIPALFILWGMLSMLAPLNVYALYRTAKKMPVMQANIMQKANLSTFFLLYTAIIIYGSIKSFITNQLAYIQVAFLCAIVVMIIGIIITAKLEKK